MPSVPITIVSNQLECLNCGDKPFSATVHDFRYCKCGNVAVDGGTDYLRRVGTDFTKIKEMSIELPTAAVDACIEAVKWADDTGRNERGVAYAVMRALRDSGIELKEKTSG